MWTIDKVISLTTRRWIYGVATAVIPLLIAYGVLDKATAPLWVALAGAIIVPGMAVAATVPATATAVVDDTDHDDDGVEDPVAIIEDPGPKHAA